jgi:hypothetical protein
MHVCRLVSIGIATMQDKQTPFPTAISPRKVRDRISRCHARSRTFTDPCKHRAYERSPGPRNQRGCRPSACLRFFPRIHVENSAAAQRVTRFMDSRFEPYKLGNRPTGRLPAHPGSQRLSATLPTSHSNVTPKRSRGPLVSMRPAIRQSPLATEADRVGFHIDFLLTKKLGG